MLDADPQLLERDRELEALERLVEAVAGSREGSVALLEGLPEIGKSRLLAAAADLARASGMRVLAAAARSSSSEASGRRACWTVRPACRVRRSGWRRRRAPTPRG